MPDVDKGPAVPFPPPFLFVAGFLVGTALERLFPMGAMPGGVPREVAGVALIVAGLGAAFAGILTFRYFRTAILPHKPAARVVDRGLYAYTRNPMYLGLSLLYAGLSLVLATWWTLALLPVVLLTLTTQVIAREERYLRRAFPVEYADYCARVRRWL